MEYFKESESRSVVSDSLGPHELYSPWNSPDQNTGMGSCSLLQGIFRTQVSRIAAGSLPAKPPSCEMPGWVAHSSVHFSRSVVSDSFPPHGLQHPRLPCPSPTLRVYPNSCPLSRWCHPTISSSVVPFSSCPQSLPASRSFQMSQLFASGGQSISVSASTSGLPMNTQDWSPLGWTGWISLLLKGLSRVFSDTTVQKHQFFGAQHSL